MPALAAAGSLSQEERLGMRLLDLERARPGNVRLLIDRSTGDDRRAIERAWARVTDQSWRSDPARFANHLDPSYSLWRYVLHLARKFREACDGTSKRQIWNLPARYGKSLLGSQWGPAWQLDRTAGKARFILTSYGQQLAVENAIGIRDRLLMYREHLSCTLRRDRRRMDRFVTDQGGGVIAAGMHGAIRGFGAGAGGGIVVDDPFKDWQEAHSANKRDAVFNQFRGTLLDRLDDESAFIVVIHHRVHEDDLTGRLLAEQEVDGVEWDHVVLPALATSPDDPLGRAIGETLEPERFPRSFHVGLARELGSYLTSALQQQEPSPEEGTELLRAWFVLVEQPPARPDLAITSWDLKLKDKEEGDFVVGQCWWRNGGKAMLVDQLRGQWDYATTENAVALLAVRHPEARAHVVESAGSSDVVIPALRRPMRDYEVSDTIAGLLGMSDTERQAVQALRRRGMSGIVPEKVTDGAKPVRARTFIAPMAEAGDVLLPAYAPWTPALLDEIAAFPNGSHDDQVDTMSQALKRLSVAQAAAKRPPATQVAKPKPGARSINRGVPTARIPRARPR